MANLAYTDIDLALRHSEGMPLDVDSAAYPTQLVTPKNTWSTSVFDQPADALDQ